MIRKILVAYDGSDAASDAFEFGMDLADNPVATAYRFCIPSKGAPVPGQ